MKAFTPEITYVAKDGTKYKVGKPNSARSFPTKRLTRPHGHWNHYYIRAINGEVRLWVNGEEVSGGYDCKPSEGHPVMGVGGSADRLSCYALARTSSDFGCFLPVGDDLVLEFVVFSIHRIKKTKVPIPTIEPTKGIKLKGYICKATSPLFCHSRRLPSFLSFPLSLKIIFEGLGHFVHVDTEVPIKVKKDEQKPNLAGRHDSVLFGHFLEPT